MDLLKLAALDEEDLEILSAHVQDAVLKVGELRFLSREKRFLMSMRRFAWEKQAGRPAQPERRDGVLQFDRVLGAKSSGILLDRPEEVLSLLTVRFAPEQTPGGTVELVFAASATIRLTVECIEARLTDLGGAWEASSRPRHDV
jgi:hypothetical protein